MKISVFDFDGTLSYGDSLEDLFYSEMTGLKFIYRIYYIYLKLLSKYGISTVQKEKEKMIKCLFHNDESIFREACEQQARHYKLSPIFDILKKRLDEGWRVIVLSASSCYFLNFIFKEMKVEIIGSEFEINNGKISGIKQHPFYKEKVNLLCHNGIEYVDESYFDSMWDYCLKKMSRNWYRIKKGIIVEKGTNDI